MLANILSLHLLNLSCGSLVRWLLIEHTIEFLFKKSLPLLVPVMAKNIRNPTLMLVRIPKTPATTPCAIREYKMCVCVCWIANRNVTAMRNTLLWCQFCDLLVKSRQGFSSETRWKMPWPVDDVQRGFWWLPIDTHPGLHFHLGRSWCSWALRQLILWAS